MSTDGTNTKEVKTVQLDQLFAIEALWIIKRMQNSASSLSVLKINLMHIQIGGGSFHR